MKSAGHRVQEFLDFLKRQTPKKTQLDLILDNRSTHKTAYLGQSHEPVLGGDVPGPLGGRDEAVLRRLTYGRQRRV